MATVSTTPAPAIFIDGAAAPLKAGIGDPVAVGDRLTPLADGAAVAIGMLRTPVSLPGMAVVGVGPRLWCPHIARHNRQRMIDCTGHVWL